MSLISATLGRLSPRYKTLAQWAKVYEEILAKREICGKTRANRRTHSDRIVRVLGRRTISSIRPHEIAAIISSLVPTQPHTAARTLVEAKDIFNEALQAGWVDSNPALDVKTPRVRIARRRLESIPADRKAPVIWGLVKLDGADTALLHYLDEVRPEEVAIGMRVKAVFAESRTGGIRDISHFKPVR